MHDQLLDFLKKNYTASLAVVGEEQDPLVATIFYVFDAPDKVIFKSRSGSEHMQRLFADPKAALGVYDHASTYSSKQGVQIKGVVRRVSESSVMHRYVELYSLRFDGAREKFAPIEKLISHEAESTLFCFEVQKFKFTSTELSIADLSYQEFG